VYRLNFITKVIERLNRVEVKERTSKISIKNWKDPEYRRKIMEARRKFYIEGGTNWNYGYTKYTHQGVKVAAEIQSIAKKNWYKKQKEQRNIEEAKLIKEALTIRGEQT